METARILIINDDPLVQRSLYEMLCRMGHIVDIADSAKSASENLKEHSYHIVLADVRGKDSVQFLKNIKESNSTTEVIALASFANTGSIMDSLKLGGFEYLIKPVEDYRIADSIERALSKRAAGVSCPLSEIKKISPKEPHFHGLVGNTDKMKDIYSVIQRISNSKATVLLRGESGTGKRVVARAIHRADKIRHDKPFIELSCGALPREIIESELFGHIKGSFTGAVNDRKGRFELADGGTILLDDIDAFTLDLQVKLLRVLQHKEFERVGDHKTMKVDVRIVVSTNQDLEKLVAEKKFREDLYYRLNVISINIPPLRARKEDLPNLTDHLFLMFSKENHKTIKGISSEVRDILMTYDWPGNVRELENVIERAVILDTDNIIGKDDLPEILQSLTSQPKDAAEEAIALTEVSGHLKDAMLEPEKVYILQILKEVGWNKKKAAVKLGVNRTTLYNKLKKYNISAIE